MKEEQSLHRPGFLLNLSRELEDAQRYLTHSKKPFPEPTIKVEAVAKKGRESLKRMAHHKGSLVQESLHLTAVGLLHTNYRLPENFADLDPSLN